MRESKIEAYLRERVKEVGGKAFKFTSPGCDGVPDRLVVLPGGRMLFVELKAPGKAPTKQQAHRIGQLRAMGCTVLVVDSREKVDGLIYSLEPHRALYDDDGGEVVPYAVCAP